ncbi:MFS transporter [Phytoactinopolyspora limicola]|uniref:MFS transporter n=1 Tax=Phytoactinopolyspora limicola TaxID=2715536 RepID=UPI00140CA4AE|nr:MFS transporter [Phytoactinopolyspora limicola]
MTTTAPEPLRRDSPFRLLWIGQTVSTTGTAISGVVMPILAYQMTGSALHTSVFSAISVVPYILFGLPAGAVADRVNRRAVIILCDIASAVTMLSVPLVAHTGELTVGHLYAAAAVCATMFVWSDAAHFSVLVSVAGRERLPAANSALWSARTVAGAVAPLMAAGLMASIGGANALIVDGTSYLVAAGAIALIPRALTAATGPHRSDGDGLMRSLATDIRVGVAFVWRQRTVRLLTLLGIGNGITAGAVFGLLVVYGVNQLGLADDDPAIGLLFSAGACGALIATLALPAASARFGAGRVTVAGLWLATASVAGLCVATSLPAALVLVACWQLGYIIVTINGITIRQRVTPDHMQGRVNASARLVAAGGQPIGALIGGMLADAASVRAALLVMLVVIGATAVAAWGSPLRRGPQNFDLAAG